MRIFLFIWLGCFPLYLSAQTDGQLDVTFGTDGLATSYNGSIEVETKLLIQPDDKILVSAKFYGSEPHARVYRYLPNGEGLDPTFGNNGYYHDYSLQRDIKDMVMLSDGSLILGAENRGDDYLYPVFVKLSPQGTLVQSFGTFGQAPIPFDTPFYSAKTIAVDAAENVYMAGNLDNRFAIVAVSGQTGLPLSTFGNEGVLTLNIGAGYDNIEAICFQPDGKLLAVGRTWVGLLPKVCVIRLLPDGSLDTDFGNNGIVIYALSARADFAKSIVLQPDGKILVGGYTEIGLYEHFALLRLMPDGNLDTTFDGDGKVILPVAYDKEQLHDLIVQADQKILLGGYAVEQSGSGYRVFMLKRILGNGTLDTSFGDNGSVDLYHQLGGKSFDIGLQSSGNIIQAGNYFLYYESISGTRANVLLARYHNTSLLSPSTAPSYAPVQVFPNPVAGGSVQLQSDLAAGEWQLYSAAGQSVAVVALRQGVQSVQLPPSIAAGLYYWQVRTPTGQVQSGKLVITQ